MERFHEIKNYRFDKLVDSYKKFGIPNFQRAYKWNSKQITDFFSSIDANPDEYFVGNIVCVSPKNDLHGRLLIIDGQQRLTTISLFLLAIRDYARDVIKPDPEESELITWIDEYLKGRDKRERMDYYVLQTRKENYHEVFSDLIESNFGIKKYDKAQLFYIRGYKTLRELIEQKVEGDIKKLEELLNKVFSLEFVVIVLASNGEVFSAFEGLNSKGLGLSVSDLVKNNLFEQAQRLNCLDTVEQVWTEIESEFEKTNPEWLPKFLRHVWISREGYISGKDLYEKIKKEVEKFKKKDNLIDYCKQLRQDSKFYLGVRTKSYEYYLNDLDEIVREVLVTFKILDNQQVYEVLLALHRKILQEKGYRPKYVRDITKVLWNFCLRTRYLAVSPSSYERVFADYCKLIKKIKWPELLNQSKRTFEILRKLAKNREEFSETLVSEISYINDSELLDYLLGLIIESREKGTFTLTKSSIEHILPQEPKEWGLKKKDIKDYVHSLGNLTLLHPKDNKDADNKIMKVKCKEIFASSPFRFNREINEKYKDLFESDWKTAIEQRGKDIAIELFELTKF